MKLHVGTHPSHVFPRATMCKKTLPFDEVPVDDIRLWNMLRRKLRMLCCIDCERAVEEEANNIPFG